MDGEEGGDDAGGDVDGKGCGRPAMRAATPTLQSSTSVWQGHVRTQVRRLRQRHPDLSEETGATLVELCMRARDLGYDIVAAVLAEGGSQLHAGGRILDAYPWMDLRNAEILCAQGFHLAR